MTQPSEQEHPSPPPPPPSSKHRVGPLQPPDRLMCSNPTKSFQSPGNLPCRHPSREAHINTIYCNLHCGGQMGSFRQFPKPISPFNSCQEEDILDLCLHFLALISFYSAHLLILWHPVKTSGSRS